MSTKIDLPTDLDAHLAQAPTGLARGHKLDVSRLRPGRNAVRFLSRSMGGDLQLAGHLYLPEGFDPQTKYPTIVFAGPFNQVKEQMGAVYGRKIAERGFVLLTFDHQGYGDSEGQLRNYEYGPAKLEGIQDAISFLRMQDFVDRERFYGIGGCAGATHMVYVALTDKRLKKIAVVSGMLSNTMVHLFSKKPAERDAIFARANEARQRAYETGEVVPFDALEMAKVDDESPRPVKEGFDYYMTARAGAETNPNYSHLTPEFFVEDNARTSARAVARYLTTPVLVVYGSEAMTKPLSQLFYFAAARPKKKLVIKGASHVDLYDVETYVDQVVDGVLRYFE
jgi:fermentation-respiration switch protein FrsA (DUF1100 family)